VAQGDDGCSADCSERCAPVGDPCLLDADCCTGESCTNGLCVSGGGGEDSCFPGDSTKTAVFIDNSGPTMLCPGIDGQTIDMAYNSSSEQWEGSSTFCNGLWTTTFKDAGSCAYELDLSTTSPCATAFTGATDSDPPEPPFSFTPFNISGGAEAPTCPVSCCTETSWDMEVVIPAGEDSCFPGVTTKTLTFDDQSVGPKCPGLDNKTVDMTYNTSNSRWEGTADYCNSTFTALFRDAGSCAYELNLSTVGDCNVSLDWTGDFNPPEPPWSYAPVGMGACTVACCPTGGSDSFYLEIP